MPDTYRYPILPYAWATVRRSGHALDGATVYVARTDGGVAYVQLADDAPYRPIPVTYLTQNGD